MAENQTGDIRREKRRILLFSDGTGNSSSSAQKTNVWRLYEALDLGYPVNAAKGRDETIQLAYYDNGVGTSSIKLLAMLGGVFGFGLARNIRDIYKFLCRNYQHGDEIYAFGFSRGAYTIRLLIAFVTRMGLVPYDQNEAELDRAARDNWREFRRALHANNIFADFLVGLGRWFARWLVTCKRGLLGQSAYAKYVKGKRPNWISEWWEHTRERTVAWWTGEQPKITPVVEYGPDIEFIGVWDTVAAYGGPILEITRAIDEWIWPLTMPDYRLSTKVKRARHALAIDDKRDSFLPLLWDEVHEKGLPGYDENNPRLQQVWFAGMHSDVGGGYSDDSLAYVSLDWMMQHAELQRGGSTGVRFLPETRARIAGFQNIYGPIHDSRGGGGAFFRYQPRYINAWVEGRPDKSGVMQSSRIFRDPTIDRGRYRDQGFLNYPIRVHKSVEERLMVATDGYAPNNLSARYIVDHGPRPAQPSAARILKDQELENFKHSQLQLGDRIKLRRFWYFISALVFTALVLKPLWPLGTIDVRTDASLIEKTANAFLPALARSWTAAIAADPFVSFATLGLLALFTKLGMGQESTMSDLAGRMWRERLRPHGFVPPPPKANFVSQVLHDVARWFHTVEPLTKLLAWLKWRLIPIILGLLIWILNWYLVAALLTQLYLVPREALPSACLAQANKAKSAVATINIANPCSDTYEDVEPGKTYKIVIETMDFAGDPGNWLDKRQVATPEGWTLPTSLTTKAKLALVTPFQRVVNAELFQPVFEVRTDYTGFWANWPFDNIFMMVPTLKKTGEYTWEGELKVPGTAPAGRLYFFLNDAVIPFDRAASAGSFPTEKEMKSKGGHKEPGTKCKPAKSAGRKLFTLGGRYRNNCGQAKITITSPSAEKPEVKASTPLPQSNKSGTDANHESDPHNRPGRPRT